MRASFGFYGISQAPANDYSLGYQYAIDRARDLGINLADTHKGSDLLHRFNCRLVKNYGVAASKGKVDLAIFECSANVFDYEQGVFENGVFVIKKQRIALLPSHLFGSITPLYEANKKGIGSGRNVAVMGYNDLPLYRNIGFPDNTRTDRSGNRQVYLSPGTIRKLGSDGVYQGRPTFVVDGAYQVYGTSGGALFDEETNRVIGDLLGSGCGADDHFHCAN